MPTIYKYRIQLIEQQFISIPKDAKILTFQYQDGEPTIWAEVDTANIPDRVRLFIIGTGHTMPHLDLSYIGTAQNNGLVWHLYKQKL